MCRYKVIIAAVTVLAAVAEGYEYLHEQPDFLKPCKSNDPDFVKCTTRNLQNIFNQWAIGIPGLEGLGKSEPLMVKKVKLAQMNPTGGNIAVELKNLTIKGFSKAVVKEAKTNEKNLSSVTKLSVPKMRLDSDYKLNGRISLLNLRGNGKMFIELDNADFVMHTKSKLYKHEGNIFFNLTSLHCHIAIGGLRAKFDNLFDGNKELENTANQLINDGWQQFFEILQPAIEQSVDAILADRLGKIYRSIPATFLLADVAKAAEKL